MLLFTFLQIYSVVRRDSKVNNFADSLSFVDYYEVWSSGRDSAAAAADVVAIVVVVSSSSYQELPAALFEFQLIARLISSTELFSVF